MIQQRLKPLEINRERKDYPQINYIDEFGTQHIEINRGCPYQCEYCYADPNFKEFRIPKIESNFVQIRGEAFLSDSRVPILIEQLGKIKHDKKVVYYGLHQGINKKNLNDDVAGLLSHYRFGRITSRGNWKKGMRISWDGDIFEETQVKKALDCLLKFGYISKDMMIFILVNYKISYKDCIYKLKKLEDWGVQVDDCTWNCSKTLYIPQYWDYPIYYKFRKKCRNHDIEIQRGYNPEKLEIDRTKNNKILTEYGGE